MNDPKPYLINVIRMPALQMLLLFAKSIDTNNNFSRIIFDSWIEARFPKPLEALKTLYQATKIRSMWQKFLTAKLLEEDNVDSERNVEHCILTYLTTKLKRVVQITVTMKTKVPF